MYAKEDATFEDVVEAAKKARLHDFIMSLSEGYDTFVFNDGCIVESGCHNELLDKGGLYYKLYNRDISTSEVF